MNIRRRLYTWHKLLMQNVLLRRRLMIILSLLPAIFLIILCNSIYVDIYEYKTNYQNTIAQLESTKNKHIDDIINNRTDIQSQNAFTIGYIQQQLRDDYKKDLLSLDNNTESYGSSKQKHLFLTDKDKSIISPKNDVTEDLFVSWSDIIDNYSNKELEKNVIVSIPEKNISNSSDVEYNKRLKDSNGKYLEITKSGIENTDNFIDNGALKAYDLLAPNYFDAGYTFTIDSNDKLFYNSNLLRSSDLYEISDPYDTYINTYNSLIKEYKEKTEYAIIRKIITCIVISSFLITLFSICLYAISNSYRFEFY